VRPSHARFVVPSPIDDGPHSAAASRLRGNRRKRNRQCRSTRSHIRREIGRGLRRSCSRARSVSTHRSHSCSWCPAPPRSFAGKPPRNRKPSRGRMRSHRAFHSPPSLARCRKPSTPCGDLLPNRRRTRTRARRSIRRTSHFLGG
jgi:hypothetical protein